jgi:hypothetical protein
VGFINGNRADNRAANLCWMRRGRPASKHRESPQMPVLIDTALAVDHE